MKKFLVAALLTVCLCSVMVSADSETDSDKPGVPEGAQLKRQKGVRNLNQQARPALQRQNAVRNLNAPRPALQRQNAVRNLNAPRPPAPPKNYVGGQREKTLKTKGGHGTLTAEGELRAYKSGGQVGAEANAKVSAKLQGQKVNQNGNGVAGELSAEAGAGAWARAQANNRGVGASVGTQAEARAGGGLSAVRNGEKVATARGDAYANAKADGELTLTKDRVAVGAHLSAEAGGEGKVRVGSKKNYLQATGGFSTGVGAGAGFSLQRSDSGKHFVGKADAGFALMAGASAGLEIGAPIPKFARTKSTNDGTRLARIQAERAARGEKAPEVQDLDTASTDDSIASSDFEDY